MMKHYKFKAKNKKSKWWVYWDLLDGLPEGIDSETVCMGLEFKDSAGNVVYEEDQFLAQNIKDKKCYDGPISIKRRSFESSCGCCGFVYGWQIDNNKFSNMYEGMWTIEVVGNNLD